MYSGFLFFGEYCFVLMNLNFQKIGPKMLDHEGKEVPGNRGYKWVILKLHRLQLVFQFNCTFFLVTVSNISKLIFLYYARYFGAAKDLPGVRELFEQERKCQNESLPCNIIIIINDWIISSVRQQRWEKWRCNLLLLFIT